MYLPKAVRQCLQPCTMYGMGKRTDPLRIREGDSVTSSRSRTSRRYTQVESCGMNIPIRPCLTADHSQQYREQGYVILRGILPDAEIEALRADVRELVEAAATGQGPEVAWINREK